MSSQESEFIRTWNKILWWFVGIFGTLITAGILGGFTFISSAAADHARHETEIKAMKELVNGKVSNEVLMEYIKVNDKLINMIISGVDKNSDQIQGLRNELHEFEQKYFIKDTKRSGKETSSLFVPNYHWFAMEDSSAMAQLEKVYNNKIGLY